MCVCPATLDPRPGPRARPFSETRKMALNCLCFWQASCGRYISKGWPRGTITTITIITVTIITTITATIITSITITIITSITIIYICVLFRL